MDLAKAQPLDPLRPFPAVVKAVRKRGSGIGTVQGFDTARNVDLLVQHASEDIRNSDHVAILWRQSDTGHARPAKVVQFPQQHLARLRNRLHAVEDEE